jgi:putative flippase GtrA
MSLHKLFKFKTKIEKTLNRIRNELSFLFIGVWNTIFGLSLFFLLLKFIPELNYFIILTISFIVSTLQSHFSQRNFVWRSSAPYLYELMKFFWGTLGSFIVNLACLPVLVEYLQFPIYFSQVLIVFLLTILSFFYQKNIVFGVNSLETTR